MRCDALCLRKAQQALVFALMVMLLIASPASLRCQTSEVFDVLTMPSKILKMDRKYAVYLPPCYETSKRSYPVLYLLHGAGDDQTGWVQFGEVRHITDKAIADGYATPMIIVMPDASEGRLGYTNDVTGEWRYEDFFFQEFMPYVEKTYRIKAEKRYRAVAGLSMGGEGSFIFALHRPDLFAACCPLSAATGPRSPADVANFAARFEKDKSRPIPDSVAASYFQRYSAVYLAETLPETHKRAVRWYIDCGDDDFLFEGNSLMHIAMRKSQIPHEFRIREGGHNWTYWRSALPEVLHFVSEGFHQY